MKISGVVSVGVVNKRKRGSFAGRKGGNRDGACTPPRSSALEGQGLYPEVLSAGSRRSDFSSCSAPLHAEGKGLLPLLPAPFTPASSGKFYLENSGEALEPNYLDLYIMLVDNQTSNHITNLYKFILFAS